MNTKLKKTQILLVLLLFSTFSYPQPLLQLSPIDLTYNQFLGNGNWQSASIIALAISLSIVSIAYIVGIGLNIPEIKVWANTELSQVFASALIIISLIAIFSFLSSFLLSITAGQFACQPIQNQPYVISLGLCYLDSLLSITNSTLKSNLIDAFENAKKSSEREGVSTNTYYTLWAAYYSGKNAGYSMYTERYSYNFDVLSGIYSSLATQKSFLSNLASTNNPQSASLSSVLIFYGVILRTFFFSRRLGGLLLAIGISLLLVWPMLYVFSWFTLKVAVFGDQMVSPPPDYCPGECTFNPPKINTCEELGSCKRQLTNQMVVNQEGETITGQTVILSCPSICREIPYPIQNPSCTKSDLIAEDSEHAGQIVKDVDVRAVCSTCPDECKVGGKSKLNSDNQAYVPYRERTTCFSDDEKPDPPEEIKQLFGENTCSRANRIEDSQDGCYISGCAIINSVSYMSPECQGKCTLCPDFCRVYYFNPLYPDDKSDDDPNDPVDGYWRIPKPSDFPVQENGESVWKACEECTEEHCPMGRSENEPNCRIGIPDPKLLDCLTLCGSCQRECRIANIQDNEDADNYFQLHCRTNPSCVACRAYCGIQIPSPSQNCANFPTRQNYGSIQPQPDGTCSACPKRCRVADAGDINCPASCLEPYCNKECKSNFTTDSPPSLCTSCLKCDDDCTTIPPIRTNCAEVCNLPTAASRDFTPAGFISSQTGAKTTMSDTKNVGVLAIPAYVLPLFNIVVLIAFIRVFSQTFGGDIELPGISRFL
ncbi:MAG: hypothetical protein QXF67_02830 [Candidatus Anstonellales archaeon]